MRTLETQGTDLVFKIAESEQELLQACRLLYKEYLRAGYTPELPSGLLVTRHHLHPGTRILVASQSGGVVSTAAIVGDTREIPLPIDELYPDELESLRSQGRIPAEACSLASDRGNLAPGLIRLFTRTLFLCCLHLGFDDVCVMVNPRHVPLYRRWCDLEIFGEERYYAKVNAPAVALRTDLRKARQRLEDEWSHNSFVKKIQAEYLRSGVSLDESVLGILEGNGDPAETSSLDSVHACRMLSAGTGLLRRLSPECRTLLQNT
jgi:hypothetical protein